MKTNKLTVLFIVTIIISSNLSIIEGQTLSSSITNGEFEAHAQSEGLSESLIEQAENVKKHLENIIEDIEDKGKEIPREVNVSFIQGLEYLDLSKELFYDGNQTGASEMAFKAIQLFGDSYKQIQSYITSTSVEDEDDIEDDLEETSNSWKLAIAIERAYRYLELLKEKVNRFSKEGFEVTIIYDALNDVEGHLDTASKYLDEGNHSGAILKFSSARTLLGRIHGFLESKIKERKADQAERFLLQFQNRVQKISGILEGLQVSVDAIKIQRVRVVLNSTALKLLMLKNRLSAANLEEIIDDVEIAVDEVEDGLDELDGNGFSNQIKTAYRFEAIVESFNETLQRYSDSGFNTSRLDTYLNNAQDFLARIQKEFRSGNKEAAEDLIEDAEELLEEAHDGFRNFQKDEITSDVDGEIERPGSSNGDGNNFGTDSEKSNTASLQP